METENILSFKASGTIPAFSFVKFGDNNTVTLATASTDNIIGVSDGVTYDNGEMADIYMQGANCEIVLGGTVSAGEALTVNSSGCAISATAGDNIGAIALNDGISGDIIKAIVTLGRTVSSESQQTVLTPVSSTPDENQETVSTPDVSTP